MKEQTQDGKQALKKVRDAVDVFQTECLTGRRLDGLAAARIHLMEVITELRPELLKDAERILLGRYRE